MIDQQIEQQAQELLLRHRISEPPVPVERMAQAEGIQIVRSKGGEQESGFLLRNDNRTIIGLNDDNAPVRQRFTIAHELGHWKLHKGRPLIVDHTVRINKRDGVSSAATDHEEIAANAFAAALLMPLPMISAAIKHCLELGVNTQQHLIDHLAKQFDVSTLALQIRLVNLGVIN